MKINFSSHEVETVNKMGECLDGLIGICGSYFKCRECEDFFICRELLNLAEEMKGAKVDDN